jgi:hypothetical protein
MPLATAPAFSVGSKVLRGHANLTPLSQALEKRHSSLAELVTTGVAAGVGAGVPTLVYAGPTPGRTKLQMKQRIREKTLQRAIELNHLNQIRRKKELEHLEGRRFDYHTFESLHRPPLATDVEDAGQPSSPRKSSNPADDTVDFDSKGGADSEDVGFHCPAIQTQRPQKAAEEHARVLKTTENARDMANRRPPFPPKRLEPVDAGSQGSAGPSTHMPACTSAAPLAVRHMTRPLTYRAAMANLLTMENTRRSSNANADRCLFRAFAGRSDSGSSTAHLEKRLVSDSRSANIPPPSFLPQSNESSDQSSFSLVAPDALLDVSGAQTAATRSASVVELIGPAAIQTPRGSWGNLPNLAKSFCGRCPKKKRKQSECWK